jgi:transcription antitermination factor NusG
MSDDWFALYTRPRHEKQVFRELAVSAIEAFLPQYKVRRRWKDRHKVIEEPLFKNYLFVRSSSPATSSRILRVYGAVGFVMTGEKPAPIPAVEIDNIRKLVESGLKYNVHPYLTVGSRVRVNSGPLQGCVGLLKRHKTQSRLILSVSLLRQSVIAEVDADTVEPILSTRSREFGLR